MADPPVPVHVRLARVPAHAWTAGACVFLSLVYVMLEVAAVRPYLPPGGTGASIAGDPASRLPLIARPPDVRARLKQPGAVLSVAAESPAAGLGVAPGSEVVGISGPHGSIDLRADGGRTLTEDIEAWRALYWLGVRGPRSWTVREAAGERVVAIDPVSALASRADGWARAHAGMIVQVIVFTGGALVLLFLRGADLTAGLCVLALVLSAIGSGGPLLGAEAAVPFGTVLTILTWLATPLAFPVIALAILYLPVPLAAHRAPPLAPDGSLRRLGADARAQPDDGALSGRGRRSA